jgi:hypothetical protein
MTFGQIRASSDHVHGGARIGPDKDRIGSQGHGQTSAHDIGHEHGQVIRELVCVQASPLIGFEARSRPGDLRRDQAAARAADVRRFEHQPGASDAPDPAHGQSPRLTSPDAPERPAGGIYGATRGQWWTRLNARSNLLNTSPLSER